MHDKKEATQQIIGASTTLLGICVVIISAIRVSGTESRTVIDDTSAVCLILFLTSFMFAYFSLRSDNPRIGLYRDIADYSFLVGILLFSMSAVFLTLNIIG